MDNLKMVSQEELAEILNCSSKNVTFLRGLGIIPAIKTGRNYMFTIKTIKCFFENYEGMDVSNLENAMVSKEIVNTRHSLSM